MEVSTFRGKSSDTNITINGDIKAKMNVQPNLEVHTLLKPVQLRNRFAPTCVTHKSHATLVLYINVLHDPSSMLQNV